MLMVRFYLCLVTGCSLYLFKTFWLTDCDRLFSQAACIYSTLWLEGSEFFHQTYQSITIFTFSAGPDV